MARSRKRRAESMSTDSGSETTADLHDVLSDESSFYGTVRSRPMALIAQLEAPAGKSIDQRSKHWT